MTWFGGMLVQVLESLLILLWVLCMIGCMFVVRLENILFWLLESVASGMCPKAPLLLVILMLPFRMSWEEPDWEWLCVIATVVFNSIISLEWMVVC